MSLYVKYGLRGVTTQMNELALRFANKDLLFDRSNHNYWHKDRVRVACTVWRNRFAAKHALYNGLRYRSQKNLGEVATSTHWPYTHTLYGKRTGFTIEIGVISPCGSF